jgi:undecaprenyl-phosphate galactose phosphotransferase
MKPTDPFLADTKNTAWFCHPGAEPWLLLAVDLLALAAAFSASAVVLFFVNQNMYYAGVTHWWQAQDLIRPKSSAVLALITVAAFWAKGHYSKRKPISNEIREVLGVAVVLAVIDMASVYFAKWQFSRGALALTWIFAPCFVLLVRTALKLLLMRYGGWLRSLVIVGWGENALETALAFEGEKLMGYSLVAFLVPDDRATISRPFTDRHGRLIPCVGLGAKPETTIAAMGDPHVVLALEQGGIDRYQDVIQQLGRRTQNIQIVPALRGLPLYGLEANHFFAHEVLLLTVRNNLARPLPRTVKRVFDIVVASAILIVCLPLFAVISARVAASGGPVFYGHRRQGQYNRSFPCYKFRTMATNADVLLQELLARDPQARAEWERDFKLKDDPRVTPIGRFLRRTSLDELPQLWNVLKGDMSLVGPRPVVMSELERYGNQVEYYLEAKPGLTGLWQISGRNDTTYDTRVYLDAWYVKNWSLFTDLMILVRTVKVIFRKEGAY